MSSTTMHARVMQKHDTEANWLKSSLVPLLAEIIIYDRDDTYPHERIKIGDGVNNVNALPFVHPPEVPSDVQFITDTTGNILWTGLAGHIAVNLPIPTADDVGKVLRVNAEGKYELVAQ